MYVVLEGGDGVGKTTQLQLLYGNLVSLGHKVIMTREPGGTEAGKQIREILFDKPELSLSKKTQAFLFMADRAEHYEKVVKPAIQNNVIVLQDRYIDSSLVYQGIINNLGTKIIGEMSVWSVDMFMPDLVITLDGESKRDVPPDSFHKNNLESAERIRKLYKTLSGSLGLTENMKRALVNADRDSVIVADEILHLVTDRLKLAGVSELREPTKRVWQEK